MNNIKRGDIYYIANAKMFNENISTSLQSGRPAIIVSNDKANANSPYIEVVYLTTANKKSLPTHVTVWGTFESIAMCENVQTINVNRIGDYVRTLTEQEQREVDKALRISLGLPESTSAGKEVPVKNPANEMLTLERDMYKRMYDELLTKVISGHAN